VSLIKTEKEIVILREGGRRLARILKALSLRVMPGVLASELNTLAEQMIIEGGDRASFLHYTPAGATRPYPGSICVSINDEVVHGIPNEGKKVIHEGDIVGIDLGLIHEGLFTDAAITVGVGDISPESRKLIEVTRETLLLGIQAARVGGTIGDIGYAIKKRASRDGFGIVNELCGHGVGHAVHEEPQVPNSGVKNRGMRLVSGMVIAIEPMLTLGTDKIILDSDGYTYRTADGSRSAHSEHTIAITNDDPLILTLE